ncbi:hypothetical protein M885DRAFT_616429 [Pelagophyceae sp. CCMP2097]|nr:hypothetical protein M885DRAFT_616429 [Pelagophyceae sp. CCMP2097]|mmetsp:Transcript_11010/g.38236  ORF Transcript_11010/g.38236 Transcript_11010/m.38236 type:complete len:146 (+) Transcript_11010:97-534(+)
MASERLLDWLDGALAHIASLDLTDAAKKRRALHVANEFFGDEEGRKLLDCAIHVLGKRTLCTIVAQPSNRSFVAVDAPGGRSQYAILGGFCTCKPFFEAAKEVATAVVCKHMLAFKLAPLLGALQTRNIPDAEFHSHLAARYALS